VGQLTDVQSYDIRNLCRKKGEPTVSAQCLSNQTVERASGSYYDHTYQPRPVLIITNTL
jgi:hypothetical protein